MIGSVLVGLSSFLTLISRLYRSKLQQEFPDLKKRYWGGRFWGRGYFSTTSGAISDDVGL